LFFLHHLQNSIIRLNGSNNNNNNETGNHNIGIILAQSQSSDESSSPRDGSPENHTPSTAQQQGQSAQSEQLVQAPNQPQSNHNRVRRRIYIPIIRPRRIIRPG
jgi:hypothetical protein